MEEREEKQTVSLQLAWTQEPRKSVRETSGPCIKGKELTIIWVSSEKAAKNLTTSKPGVLLVLL